VDAKLSVNSLADPMSSTGAGVIARVGKGLGALSTGAAVQIAGQLTIVPVALYAWGKVRYGEWVLLTGLVTFLRLVDLGLQTFVVNRLCASYARGERDDLQTTLHSSLRVQIPLASTILMVVGIVLLVLPIDRSLALQTVSRTTFQVVAMLLAFELLLGIPMGVIAGIYRATGRLPRAAVIGASQQGAAMILTVALIVLHADFITLAAARVAVAILFSGFILYDLHRLHPWLRLRPSGGSWSDGVWMIGPGLFFIAIPFADYLTNQFTLMVLQRSLNGGEVSRLATHRTVVNVAILASGLLTNAIWPELTALHARAQTQQLIKTHRSLARLNLWLVASVAFIMLPVIPLVYPSWTAGRLTIDSWTLAFLLTRIVLWGIWSASLTLLCAINRQKSVAVVLFGAALITSATSIVLIPRMGMSGAALAQLIGDISLSAWLIPLLAAREIGERFSHFLYQTFSALVLGILIPLALGLVGWNLIHLEAVRLIVLLPAMSLLAFGLMWKQLAAYERTHLFSLVKTRFAQG